VRGGEHNYFTLRGGKNIFLDAGNSNPKKRKESGITRSPITLQQKKSSQLTPTFQTSTKKRGGAPISEEKKKKKLPRGENLAKGGLEKQEHWMTARGTCSTEKRGKKVPHHC